MTKKHPHMRGNESLMDLARRNKAAADAGITDELSAFMATFHPEVDMHTPTMIRARQDSRRRGRGY
jgi:hypothetical protein